jgi:hypothetical protein
MLVFEGVSVALILMLAFLALAKTGVADAAQWHPGRPRPEGHRPGRGGRDLQLWSVSSAPRRSAKRRKPLKDDSPRGHRQPAADGRVLHLHHLR